MIVKLIERGVSWQSTHVLNAAKLVQNPPDREINMKLVERSYLRRQRKAAVEYFTAKGSCCDQYFIFGARNHVFASADDVCLSLVC